MAASGKALEELHAAVATVLAKQLEATDDEGSSTVSASTIAAAITFLKNNNITATADNAELANLRQTLANRRSKRVIPTAVLSDAADEMNDRFQLTGGPLQ